jgi:hypothetical protein
MQCFQLIDFKGILFASILAQTLQLPPHACHSSTYGADDMSLIQEKFTSLFSNYEVSTAPRPDGGILLTLRSSDGKVFKRALSYQQLHAGDQLSWAISAIRRDLAEQASELPQIAMLQSQQRFALPTYHSL